MPIFKNAFGVLRLSGPKPGTKSGSYDMRAANLSIRLSYTDPLITMRIFYLKCMP